MAQLDGHSFDHILPDGHSFDHILPTHSSFVSPSISSFERYLAFALSVIKF